MSRSGSSSPNPGRPNPGRPTPARRARRPALGPYCDEDEAVARLSRSADVWSDRIDAQWSDGIALSLSVETRAILTGALDVQILNDGAAIEIPRTYECVLWHTDRDCDYLELQTPLPNEAVLEFQVVLSRPDRYACLAVKVAGLPKQRTDVTVRWPLSPAVTSAADVDTREIGLREGSVKPVQRVRAFPLSLPEDRSVGSPGHFVVVDGAIELKHVGAGNGAYVPLVLDWNPDRRKAPADWRTLTVAEEGTALRSDQAAAHRIRIGLEHHLLIYHSLLPSPLGRSVLGHNTRHETLFGLFSDCGNVETVMAVE